jgi:hypothetical protein
MKRFRLNIAVMKSNMFSLCVVKRPSQKHNNIVAQGCFHAEFKSLAITTST